MTTVHKLSTHRRPLPNDPTRVYIGRPSIWGNPYVIGRDGTRSQVIERYKMHIACSPRLIRRIHELRGKQLYCHCAPLACHGDYLAELTTRTDAELEAWASAIEQEAGW